jgi:hypothetical protein
MTLVLPHKPVKRIVSCEFSYRCPRDWAALAPTADADIRHFGTCARDVYLCHNAEQLMNHTRAGHCVAIRQEDAERGERLLLGMPRSAGGDEHLEFEPLRRKPRTR